MDGFSYYNIFDTKGIEYIAILLFFALLIPYWLLLNKQVKITKQIQKSLGILTANILIIPQGLFYAPNHTWSFLEKSGLAKVGLDDLLLHITGEVKFSNLRDPGEKIKKGDLLAEIEQKGRFLRIFSPISGEIMNTNPILRESPETLNEDPYGKGWICKIKPSNWVADTSSLHIAEEATAWSTMELDRFKDFVAVSVSKYSPGVIMQEGGELRDNTLAELPNEVWQDFQQTFMS